MHLDLKWIKLIINSAILIICVVGTAILVWKTKFEDNNYRLLFILYTLCWIGPMILREYTSQIHTKMYKDDPIFSSLLWIPLSVYGIVGLFWKPLTDLLAYKFKSRKKVIYVSLIFQFACYIPLFVYPCFTTNIIQSIGCGVGASIIGLFNLMFNEQHAKKRIFLTATLLSLPPLVAEFISSVIQSLITSLIGAKASNQEFIDITKWLWMIAIVFLVIAALLAIFVKENRSLIYQDNKYREPIKHSSEWTALFFLCLIATITSFTKFTTSGSASLTQLDFIAAKWWGKYSINGYDGYLSVIFTIGQIAGNLLMGYIFSKKFSKLTMFIGSTIIWMFYVIAVSSFGLLNPGLFMMLNILNGFAFGLIYNIIVSVILKKYFIKTNKITPISLYNTSLSLGIVASTWFNPWMKGEVFGEFNKFVDKMKDNETIPEQTWNKFVHVNWIVNIVVLVALCLMIVLFISALFLQKKNKLLSTIDPNKNITN